MDNKTLKCLQGHTFENVSRMGFCEECQEWFCPLCTDHYDQYFQVDGEDGKWWKVGSSDNQSGEIKKGSDLAEEYCSMAC